jgi:hypothetical protein
VPLRKERKKKLIRSFPTSLLEVPNYTENPTTTKKK